MFRFQKHISSDVIRYLLFLFVTVLTLVIYIKNLAPGLTLEDSGELLTALYFKGIPHPPGYPLYTFLGGLFIDLFNDKAWAGNLFSALLMSIGVGVYFLILLELSDNKLRKSTFLAILVSLFVATRPHVIRQALITEVYGLHIFLTTISTYLFIKWIRSGFKNKYFYLCAFVCGLGLSNHHLFLTQGLLFLIVYSYLLFKKKTTAKVFVIGSCFGLFGLYPYLSMYLKGQKDLYFSWGDPSNFDKFIGIILRRQYNPKITRSLEILAEQFREEFIHLFYNFNFLIILFSIIVFVLFLQKNTALKSVLIISFFLTGPLVAFIINFVIPIENSFSYLEVSNLTSVFFIPNYYIIGIIIYFSCNDTLLNLKSFYKIVSLVLIGLYFTYDASLNIDRESKSNYKFAYELFDNLHKALKDEPAIVISNWDPFSFPPMYLNLVQKKYPNLIFIDFVMLRDAWYQKSLKKWYPQLTKLMDGQEYFYEIEFEKFILDRSADQIKKTFSVYHQLGRNIIYNGRKQGYKIVTLVPNDIIRLDLQLIKDFKVSELGIGSQLYLNESEKIPWIDPQIFDFKSFENKNFVYDRMAKMLSSYYSLSISRSVLQKYYESSDDLKKDSNWSVKPLEIAENLGRWDPNALLLVENIRKVIHP